MATAEISWPLVAGLGAGALLVLYVAFKVTQCLLKVLCLLGALLLGVMAWWFLSGRGL